MTVFSKKMSLSSLLVITILPCIKYDDFFSETSSFLGGVIYNTATASNMTMVLAKNIVIHALIYLQYCHRVVFEDGPPTTVVVQMSFNFIFFSSGWLRNNFEYKIGRAHV